MSTTGTVIATFEKNRREQVRVILDRFGEYDLVHIRCFVPPKNGEGDFLPTQKGLAVRVEQLGTLISALQKAEAEVARRSRKAA
jgi:hypothetical protein